MLFQRGEFLPLAKGGKEGFLKRIVGTTMRPFINSRKELKMKRPTQTKEDVLSASFEHRTQIKDLGVKKLGLFGSFLHGRQTADSDVDLLVEFEPSRKTFDKPAPSCWKTTFSAV
jgi:hypothetical protein